MIDELLEYSRLARKPIALADVPLGPSVFQRLHTDVAFEGTGIGLAHVKRIVERHGGQLGVDAKPGEGATFWFELDAA
ncbi:MAG: ATP-binding protein [Proteobacteria bacterium]|nr:ATP-binding protein [Pseudomonadota bacterium]